MTHLPRDLVLAGDGRGDGRRRGGDGSGGGGGGHGCGNVGRGLSTRCGQRTWLR